VADEEPDVKRAVAVLAVLLVTASLWGFLIEPRLIDRRALEGSIPGLPAAWEGAEVVFLSDFQVGIWLDNIGTARRMVAQVVEERPDLVLLGGDYVYSDSPDAPRQVSAIVDLFRPLTEARLPTYAVLGNHDIEQDAGELLEQELSAIGIPVLLNEAVALPAPGDPAAPPLHLVAVGPHVPGRDDPAQALRDVPDAAPRLVLMHNPDTFPAFPPRAAPLALAGHTHGGQIRIPFLPEWSYLALVQGGQVTADGFIDDYGEPGNQLYVSRGVGMSVLPMRLFCPPELTVVTLHAA
jgi:predicted MPP superfamily phosphohydrolase